MRENFIVERRTAAEIDCLALEWRETFGVQDKWAPDLVQIFEKQLPDKLPGFEFVRQPDSRLGRAEAFTRHPRIFVRQSLYEQLLQWDGRARLTVAHELGHLVMHPDTPLPRMVLGNRPAPIDEYNRSAEWQATKFAVFFLMPEHIVREFALAEELAEHCKVSLAAAQNRFKEVGHFKPPLTPSFLAFWADWKKKYT
jgi:Zn-dependent peptidase ImmA (M78 family)